jgi:UPF0716 protein FxsA
VIFVALFLLAALELFVLIQVGSAIGALNTIALVILVSIAGIWLVKRQGISVLRRARSQSAAGRVPANEMLDGLLILVAGFLLLVPGFVTDVVAILFVLPPTRAAVRRMLARRFGAGTHVVRATYSGRIVDDRRGPDDGTGSRRPPPPELDR